MTAPFTRMAPADISAVSRMKSDATERDQAMSRVRLIRDGKFAEVWPDHFSEAYPTALVANFVDQAARDIASNLSPLPSLACSSGAMRTNRDKARAEKKNRIGANYWRHAKLEVAMKYGADQYLTYGFLPCRVQADYKAKLPRIYIDDPEGAYFELDRDLCTKRYARVWRQSVEELAALYPEYARMILFNQYGQSYAGSDTEVVHFIDDTHESLYLPERGNAVVARFEHKMPYCPVHIALRPGLHRNPRGQFDDVLWVQLAHAVMAALTMEAGHKAVQAPLAVPSDVNELNIGPDSLLVSDSPEKIQRVPLQVPSAALALGEQLKEEMKEGVGYPASRLGNVTSSAITGRGISALEGGFDSQIKLGQDVLKLMLITVTGMSFEMDTLLWPHKRKTISGVLSGESFEINYTPAADIGDNYTCDVSYGFASGVGTSGAIVTLLQLQGGGIIGKDTFRRQLPFDIDVDQQQRETDVESLESALIQALAAGTQATSQMIAMGQTQEAVSFFQAVAEAIDARRRGDELSKVVLDVFSKQAQAQQAAAQAQQQAAADQQGAAGGAGPPGGGDDALPGVGPNGLPYGTAPGQAALAPGGRPAVTDLSAGFTGGGKADMGALVRRRIPTQ